MPALGLAFVAGMAVRGVQRLRRPSLFASRSLFFRPANAVGTSKSHRAFCHRAQVLEISSARVTATSSTTAARRRRPSEEV